MQYGHRHSPYTAATAAAWPARWWLYWCCCWDVGRLLFLRFWLFAILLSTTEH